MFPRQQCFALVFNPWTWEIPANHPKMSKRSWNRCRGKKTEEKFWTPVFVVVLRRLSFDFLLSPFSFVFAWRRFEVKQLTATQHFNTQTLPWPSVTPRGLHDLEGSKYSCAWRTAALKKKGMPSFERAGLPVDVKALKIQAINLWIFRVFENLLELHLGLSTIWKPVIHLHSWSN